MTFSKFARENGMIGQVKLLSQLDLYVEGIRQGDLVHMLILGGSGYGKTFTTDLLLRYLDIYLVAVLKATYKEYAGLDIPTYTGMVDKNTNTKKGYFVQSQTPDNDGKVKVESAGDFFVDAVDEAHKIKNPETLYGILDADTKVLILMTNKHSKLKTEIRNGRAKILKVVPYSEAELLEIAKQNLRGRGLTNKKFLKAFAEFIVFASKGVPRTVVSLADDLVKVVKYVKGENLTTASQVIAYVKNYMGIREDGLTEEDILYLSKLHLNGGKAGLQALSTLTRLQPDVLEEMEGYLINEGYVIRPFRREITEKGRRVVEQEKAKDGSNPLTLTELLKGK